MEFGTKNAKLAARRRRAPKGSGGCRKNKTLNWSLPGETRVISVCKSFFLTTLGFCQTNADAVFAAVDQGDICPEADRRGDGSATNRLNVGLIKEHIWKFHPIKHHYRYEHAPNRFYLPQDLTVAQMHHDYLLQQDAQKCSFETYRKVVRSMNISFTRLAGEECSRCSVQLQHTAEAHGKVEDEPRHHEDGCDLCDAHTRHLDHAKEAREAYRADADKVSNPDVTYMSADMMKVYMLPQLLVKGGLFTQRLTCYNETFSPLMP